jgi:hypothetical protein
LPGFGRRDLRPGIIKLCKRLIDFIHVALGHSLNIGGNKGRRKHFLLGQEGSRFSDERHGDGDRGHGRAGGHLLSLADIDQGVLVRSAVVDGHVGQVGEEFPRRMARFRNFQVGMGRDRNHFEALRPGLYGNLDGRRIQTAVREGDQAVPRFELVALQKDLGVAFPPLQPQQLPRPARADHVEPHQPRVI